MQGRLIRRRCNDPDHMNLDWVKENPEVAQRALLSIDRIDKIPEGSGLEKYNKDFSLVLKKESDIDDFIKIVFNDSMAFLKQKLAVDFPIIILTKCYNSKDFEKLWCATGKSGKRPTAFIMHSTSPSVPANIVIDLQTLLSSNPESFVANLVLNVMEELLHSVYPLNTEGKTKELLYPLAEGFLCIKLPEEYKSIHDPEI